jgi:hypothetical protein
LTSSTIIAPHLFRNHEWLADPIPADVGSSSLSSKQGTNAQSQHTRREYQSTAPVDHRCYSQVANILYTNLPDMPDVPFVRPRAVRLIAIRKTSNTCIAVVTNILGCSDICLIREHLETGDAGIISQ